MHFGFALKLSNVDFLNIDLLETHLDLLDRDIPSILFVSIMSSRRLQDVFSVTIFCLPRRLQNVLQDVFKTFLQDIFKTSWKT